MMQLQALLGLEHLHVTMEESVVVLSCLLPLFQLSAPLLGTRGDFRRTYNKT